MKINFKIALILLYFSINLAINASTKKDSLLVSVSKIGNHDTTVINLYCSLAGEYMNEGNADSALIFLDKAMNLSKNIVYEKGNGIIYAVYGRFYYERANYKESIKNYEISIKIFKDLGLKYREAKAIIGIAPNFGMLGDVQKSLKYNLQALNILESIDNNEEVSRAYSNIGNLYEKIDDINLANKYFWKCIILSKKNNYKKILGTALYNLSRTFYSQKNLLRADSCSSEAYSIFKELNYTMGLSYVIQNRALIATELKDYKRAEQLYYEGILIGKKIDDKNILSYSYGGLSDVFIKQKKYIQAIENLNLAMPIALEIENLELVIDLNERYSEAYYSLGEYKKAIETHIIFSHLKDSLFQANRVSQIAEMQTKYETEKKQKENIELIEKNKTQRLESEKNKVLLYASIGGAIALLIIALILYNRNALKQKTNKKLELVNKEIHLQKDLVEEKNKEITDSINYALRIQQSILTNDNYFKKHTTDFFILFKPKDIVSGDFYWALNHENKFIVMTADCTGHGVPGAMMSMMGVNFLNEIVNERRNSNPANILNQLRKDIIKTLNPEDSVIETKDGLDCCLCSFDFNKMKLTYSNANNSFYIIRDKELITSQSNKMPVGAGHNSTDLFKEWEIDLRKNDIVITLTDGYADQFGGPKGKKFKYKQLETILLESSHLPLNEMKNALNSSIDSWRGNLEQVDDICIIGIKV